MRAPLSFRRGSRATAVPASGPAGFSDADLELIATLDNLDGAVNYANWILDLLRPALGRHVLEVGAGHGTFTERLLDHVGTVVATDLSVRCADVLRERFASETRVQVLQGSLDVAAGHGPYDTALLINVLEHIEDDAAALRQLRDLIRPGGRLVLWVPALPILYSDFDRSIGHFRRYRLGGLRRQLVGAGFAVADIRYVNAIGAVAWLAVARLLRRTPTAGGPVKVYDRYFVPVVRWAESKGRPPFGQSVLAIAARPFD